MSLLSTLSFSLFFHSSLPYNKMKFSSTTQTLKKLTIDFDNSLKHQPPRQKDIQLLTLTLFDKKNKAGTCASIIQKLKNRKANRQSHKDQVQNHSFVGYREQLERRTVDLCDINQEKRQRDSKQDFQPLIKKRKFKYGDSLRISFIDRRQENKSFTSNYIRKERDQAAQNRQSKQEEKDTSFTTINPYTRSQYKYLQNQQIDVSIRNSVSLKKVRNSITNSYKVATIHLNPPSKQKHSLKLMKKVYQWKDTPVKKKQRHEDSVIEPWGWTVEQRMDVS